MSLVAESQFLISGVSLDTPGYQKAADFLVDEDRLEALDKELGGFDGHPIPQFSYLDADMPELREYDSKADPGGEQTNEMRKLLEDEIEHNRNKLRLLESKQRPEPSILGSLFGQQNKNNNLLNDENTSHTHLRQLHDNNRQAVQLANTLNRDSQRLNYAFKQLSNQIEKAGLQHASVDEMTEEARRNPDLKRAADTLLHAKANMFQHLNNEKTQSILKTLQDNDLVGKNTKFQLNKSIEAAKAAGAQNGSSVNNMLKALKDGKKINDALGSIVNKLVTLFSRSKGSAQNAKGMS